MVRGLSQGIGQRSMERMDCCWMCSSKDWFIWDFWNGYWRPGTL